MKQKTKITIVSGFLIIIGWSSAILNFSDIIFNSAMIIASIVAGYQVALNAYNTLKMKVMSIDTLVTIAAVGALIIGEYWEAAAVTFLFTLGSYLESRSMKKTRNAIRNLMELAPNKATVIRENKERQVKARKVQIGEIVIVHPGEKIPVDGIILKGEALTNCELCLISKKDLEELILNNPRISYRLLGALSSRLKRAEDDIESLALKNAKQKTIRLLVDLAQTEGKKVEKGIKFKLPLSREGLASFAGMTQETLSRKLSQLEDENVIIMKNRKEIIINEELL